MTPRGRLVVATRNPHKLAELEQILADWELVPLPEEVELPPEDGETFADNALRQGARRPRGDRQRRDRRRLRDRRRRARRPSGVRSARFAGRSDATSANLELLLESVGPGRRPPRRLRLRAWRTSAPTEPSCSPRAAARACSPSVPRGSGGFGYDPAFLPDRPRARRRADDGRAQPRREARDQPPRPRRARARRAARRAARGGGVMSAARPSPGRRSSRSSRTRC